MPAHKGDKLNDENLSLFGCRGWNRKQKARKSTQKHRIGLIAVLGGRPLTQMSELLLLGGLLKRVGNFDPSKFRADFDQRLVTQKTVYLMQAFGLYLGYLFTWYIRGPYSPSLTRDVYGLTDIYQHIPEVKFADPNSESRFQEFLHLQNTLHDKARMWEILASAHFLRHLNPDMNESELFKELRSRKAVSRARFEGAVELLKRHGLF